MSTMRIAREWLTAAVLAGVAALGGCGDSFAGPDRAPTSPNATAPALSRSDRDANRDRGGRDRDARNDDDEKARRLVGQCVTTFQFLDQTRAQIDGTCKFRGLGRMTLSATQTVTPGPNGLVIESTSTYTAANGDQLIATFTGIGIPDATGRVCFTGTNTFQGGTGRGVVIGRSDDAQRVEMGAQRDISAQGSVAAWNEGRHIPTVPVARDVLVP